jgi:hypothetical protein
MKKINPIQSWINGKSVTATIFNLYPIGGELFKYARFYYALLDENMGVCASGNLDMTGEAYQAWGNNDEYAYTWSASPEVLNLTIVGDYVPPVPEPIAEIYVGEPSILEVEPRSSVLGQIRQDAPIDEILGEMN